MRKSRQGTMDGYFKSKTNTSDAASEKKEPVKAESSNTLVWFNFLLESRKLEEITGAPADAGAAAAKASTTKKRVSTKFPLTRAGLFKALHYELHQQQL